MQKRNVLGVTIAAAVILAFVLPSRLTDAAESGGIALTGRVSSIEDGPMEGVVVSAKQDGSTVTTSVVSDPGATSQGASRNSKYAAPRVALCFAKIQGFRGCVALLS